MHLFLVRHGDAEYTRSLSEKGSLQMQQLSSSLKSKISNTNVIIISSPALRAHQSAQIIADELSSKVEISHLLGNEEGDQANFDNLLVCIHALQVDYDAIIMVTHNSTVDWFPFWYLEREPGYKGPPPFLKKVEQGQAAYIAIDQDQVTFSIV